MTLPEVIEYIGKNIQAVFWDGQEKIKEVNK